MNPLVSLLLTILLVFDVSSAKGTNNCNDECLTKTYCLSPEGSNGCSKNNLVTAKWSVRLQNRNDDILGLTLFGYGIGINDEKTISLTIEKLPSVKNNSLNYLVPQNVYSCYKSPFRATSSQVTIISTSSSTWTVTAGSSFYSKNVLTCSWSFTKTDPIYPLLKESDVDLVTQTNFQLSMQYGEVKGVIATDTSELPIYRMQFLKCCYKVHGNNEYLMITNQTKYDSYLVQMIDTKPKLLRVSLTDSDGTKLIFTCNSFNKIVGGVIWTLNGSTSISNQLYYTHADTSRCTWSHPLVLVSYSSQYDTTNGVYDLQITSDDVVVYSEKGIKLSNGSVKLLTSYTTMIMIIVSVSFHIIK